ncbi:protein phosphatase 2C domain-containing protein [Besnoitia besnoiti]|uniref:Protein phosphatase 2C domain-containing protein n=1 Tax=Besnoitia besnoiti TaxID=94643 RepID=A0A2A9MKN6_BESBE|nr:protein phosphatase 2C domain-containing protein [Besnoitia besnoiti]PFH36556.1 protein phosphatase 2C domain-containing protein [Besnoitia besnoiti]
MPCPDSVTTPSSRREEGERDPKRPRGEASPAPPSPSSSSSLQIRMEARFMQGRRPKQEDRHVLISDISTLVEGQEKADVEALGCTPKALVALFDGHCGATCSEFCAAQLPSRLVSYLVKPLPKSKRMQLANPPAARDAATASSGAAPSSPAALPSRASETSCLLTKLPSALSASAVCPFALPSAALDGLFPSLGPRLVSAFKHVDREFLAKYRTLKVGGCTAVACLMLGDFAVVASVGDSRAVAGLLKRKRREALRVSRDHKPNLPEERERIEANGGQVIEVGGVARVAPRGFQERAKQIKMEQCLHGGTSKPPPVLMAVSRGFGDKELKEENLITATPDVFGLHVTEDVRLLLIACDGVWDVMTDQEAVEVAGTHLDDPREAASQVVKRAFERGSQDNLTVVAVVFSHEERD